MGIDDDNGAGTPAGLGDTVAQNTDTHLWPITTPADAPDEGSIHVTAGGGIGISVGGCVIVMRLRDWHELASATIPKQQPKHDWERRRAEND